MDVYSHIDLAEKTAALLRLPGLAQRISSASEAQIGKSCREVAQGAEESDGSRDEDDPSQEA